MGPWSRSFIAAVAGNAERPDLEVTDLKIEPGVISARVDGCEVTLTAAPIPQRIWTAVTRYAKGMGQLEDAVEGRVQSVHLEHLLEEDWGEQLIPRPRAIAQICECDAGAACRHAAAVAYAVADRLEHAPRLLSDWRGLHDPELEPRSSDPWAGSPVSGVQQRLHRPVGSVAQRLGASGIPTGDGDLEDALRVAYAAFTMTQ